MRMIKNIYENMCSHFQPFEVWIRHLYYYFFNNKISKKILNSRSYAYSEKYVDKYKIIKYIESLGIKKGDILIVHSSMDGLASLKWSEKQIIDWLLELLGSNGTLCMPAFPWFKKDDFITDTVTGESIIKYDVRKTMCWTGALPNIFLKYPGVIRSKFPYNPLCAKGKYATEMMKYNIKANKPHGKNSSWEFCIRNHAKILYLGCNMHHSCTIVHTREDMDDSFPVEGWYDNQKYVVMDGKSIETLCIKQRSAKWAKYFSELYFAKIFEKKGLSVTQSIDSVKISYMDDAYKVYTFLMEQDPFKCILFRIPKRYDLRKRGCSR